ncbi:flagellar biosynthetic protein FliR [Aliiruegeria haliotis]|uniref:flagellar biosynthetic protein FliR n=1 Tax=Aliiruegeria haliotis TaxID=1280846 RepID=UPI001FE2C4F2|nr:flagellar biosynthetic protein FliR [Aliiruegeria haliotis]
MSTLVFLRIGAAMAVLPAFGERFVSQRVRLAAALGFTAIVAPVIVDTIPVELPAFPRLLVTETLIGLAFGISLRLMIMGLQIAGSIAAQSMSLSQIFGNSATDPLPAFGHLLTISALAFAAMAGLHVRVAEALVEGFHLFPIGTVLEPGPLAEVIVSRASQAFALGFSLSAPFVIAGFVYNLALGAINRAMPQLMVVLVGAPAVTGAGLALLAIASPFLIKVWFDAFDHVLASPFWVN